MSSTCPPIERGEHPFFTPAFAADRYAVYRRLRREAPVYTVRRPGAAEPEEYVLTRHEDVRSVLHDERFSVERMRAHRFRAEQAALAPDLRRRRERRSMLTRDPPAHTRLRSLVSRAFTPRRVAELRPRICRTAEALLDDALRDDRRIELVHDLAEPLPLIVIAELLGVPPGAHRRFRTWSQDLIRPFTAGADDAAFRRFRRSRRALRAFLRGIVAERRREPRNDLVSALLAAREEDDALSEDELLATCTLLLVAGHETTTNLLASGVATLLLRPEALARLRRDPDRTESAVEEMLRFESPIQAVARVAREELEVGGVRLPAGAMVTAALGAANRDPAVFAEPEHFDVDRAPNPHLAFGSGIHFCLGAALARLEAQVALPLLLDRLPDLRLAGDRLAFRRSALIRGLRELPVVG